ALIDVGNAAFGSINVMSNGLGDLIDRFATFLETAAEAGKVTEWIDGAIAVFSLLAEMIGNVIGIFSSFADAMTAAGGETLGVLGALLGAINDFFASASGQEALINIFTALQGVTSALGPIFSALG